MDTSVKKIKFISVLRLYHHIYEDSFANYFTIWNLVQYEESMECITTAEVVGGKYEENW